MDSPASQIPLVVDLDGTLIRTDLMWESLSRLLRRNPLALFQILFWWSRGRALLKQKLAARVRVDPSTLPYHEKFLAWLREEKAAGRKLILATASDVKMARPVADHVGLFDEVLASDGRTNLRIENKLRALTEKFGERGFDYAGNSTADYAVWRGSRQAVVVNASPAVLAQAAHCTRLGPAFCDHYSSLEIARSVSRELFWRSGYLLAVLAGMLLAGAFPKTSLAGFAWIAPALLLLAARGKRGADAFRVGYIGGLAFWLTSLYWLLFMPVTGFPILGWMALGAYLAVYFGIWVWFVASAEFPGSSWSGRVIWMFTGAAAWVGLEMLRGWLFTGFPWSFLGVSQYKLVPLIQIASITGVYGVSFVVAWFSLALYAAAEMIYRHPARRHAWQAEIAVPIFGIVLLFVGGMFWINHNFRTARARNPDERLRVVSIQPSVPQTLIWSEDDDEKRFGALLAASQQAMTNRPDLLLWPESAVPTFDGVYSLISHFAESNHVAIIFNGDDVDFSATATNFYNSAFIIQTNGVCNGIYHKQKLVIFGEYVPLANWLPFLKWLTPIEGGWTPGDRPVVFQLSDWNKTKSSHENVIRIGDNFSSSERAQPVKLAPLICFEDVFPAVARKVAATDSPDLMVNLTNDGWFGNSAEQWQHLANAVFRAVENGIPLVRSANNGITGWIDECGRVRQFFQNAHGSEYGAGSLLMEIPVRTASDKNPETFYQRHGDWFGWGCLMIFGLTMTIHRQRLWRKRG